MSDNFKIGNLLYIDKDRENTVCIDGNKFLIKALLSKELKEIAKRKSYDIDGLPESSFSTGDLLLFERDATLDVAILEGPDWWSNAEECPDEDLKNQIYKEIQKNNIAFQKALKKNRRKKRSS